MLESTLFSHVTAELVEVCSTIEYWQVQTVKTDSALVLLKARSPAWFRCSSFCTLVELIATLFRRLQKERPAGWTSQNSILLWRKKLKKSSPKQIKPAEALRAINPDAAGIDLGSEELYACVPPDRDSDFVQRYSTFTADLKSLVLWFKKCRIKTVAIEATGVYWVPVYEMLESEGIEVCLINPAEIKRRKKSDVLDCQLLQQLHSYKLLEPSFRPEDGICVLRSLVRHRQNLIKSRSIEILHMQKSLKQMNLQLTNVLSDLSGLSGMRIIRAIVAGEVEPKQLALLADANCRSSKETIERSLEGNYRSEHLFTLKQALKAHDFYCELISECEEQIRQQYEKLAMPVDLDKFQSIRKQRRKTRHDPTYDLGAHLYKLCGIDITRIPGINAINGQTILSETGIKLSQSFPTEKHFTSWLRLSPNRRTSAKKVISSKVGRSTNPAMQAFYMAGKAMNNEKSVLGSYYRRMRGRLGPEQAAIATAHKIARIFYHCITRHIDYDQTILAKYDQLRQRRYLHILKRNASAYGFELVPRAVT